MAPALLAGGTAATIFWAYFSARPAPAPNPFRTPGVKNIEASYRGAGATGTHTPAYGGTKQGDRSSDTFRGEDEGTADVDGTGATQMKSNGKKEYNVSGPNETKDGPKGMASRDIGQAQRPPRGQSTPVGKMYNRAQYGNEDQK